jgi:hypothetical protein
VLAVGWRGKEECMARKDRHVPEALRRNRQYVKWSEALGRRICERMAKGERLAVICRDPGMPTPEAVAKWSRSKPSFEAALAWAKRLQRREAQRGWSAKTVCVQLSDEVFQRLCEGDSLTAIGRDPQMPSMATLMRWRKSFPEFEETVQLGMRVRAERMADEGWEMALAATPETAYLTNVQLGQLRWMAGVMAPRVFGARRPESAAAQETTTVLVRTFTAEKDPVTGKMKVVSLCPNPVTGKMERTDVPGWEPTPPDAVVIPAG